MPLSMYKDCLWVKQSIVIYGPILFRCYTRVIRILLVHTDTKVSLSAFVKAKVFLCAPVVTWRPTKSGWSSAGLGKERREGWLELERGQKGSLIGVELDGLGPGGGVKLGASMVFFLGKVLVLIPIWHSLLGGERKCPGSTIIHHIQTPSQAWFSCMNQCKLAPIILPVST